MTDSVLQEFRVGSSENVDEIKNYLQFSPI